MGHLFQYRLRDLILALTIVALVLGWWSDRSRLSDDLELERRNCELLKIELTIERKAKHELRDRLDPNHSDSLPAQE